MTPEIEKHLKFNLPKKQIIINNFIGGVAWGVGTVVGATLIVTLGGAILNYFGVFDSFKLFIEQLEAIPAALQQYS